MLGTVCDCSAGVCMSFSQILTRMTFQCAYEYKHSATKSIIYKTPDSRTSLYGKYRIFSEKRNVNEWNCTFRRHGHPDFFSFSLTSQMEPNETRTQDSKHGNIILYTVGMQYAYKPLPLSLKIYLVRLPRCDGKFCCLDVTIAYSLKCDSCIFSVNFIIFVPISASTFLNIDVPCKRNYDIEVTTATCHCSNLEWLMAFLKFGLRSDIET